MIDDLHTTLIILRLPMPIVQKATFARTQSQVDLVLNTMSPMLISITDSKRGSGPRGAKTGAPRQTHSMYHHVPSLVCLFKNTHRCTL